MYIVPIMAYECHVLVIKVTDKKLRKSWKLDHSVDHRMKEKMIAIIMIEVLVILGPI